MPDTSVILAVTGTFLLAGMVKGVIGLGLPTVSLALLTVAFDLPSAMALLLVPSFATNLWQALAGAHTREVALRIWPFLLMATATAWVGAAALTRVDLALLTALLGVLLASYALLSLGGVRLAIPLRHESWAGLLSAGAVLPALAGMVLGQRLRARLSEQRFRTVFFVALLMLGTYIIVAALGKLA